MSFLWDSGAQLTNNLKSKSSAQLDSDSEELELEAEDDMALQKTKIESSKYMYNVQLMHQTCNHLPMPD